MLYARLRIVAAPFVEFELRFCEQTNIYSTASGFRYSFIFRGC